MVVLPEDRLDTRHVRLQFGEMEFDQIGETAAVGTVQSPVDEPEPVLEETSVPEEPPGAPGSKIPELVARTTPDPPSWWEALGFTDADLDQADHRWEELEAEEAAEKELHFQRTRFANDSAASSTCGLLGKGTWPRP